MEWQWVVVVVGVVAVSLKVLQPAQKGKNPRKPKTSIDYRTVKYEEAIKSIPATQEQFLVVGCGSLGCRLVDALILRGETKVRAFDIRKNAHLNDKAEFVQGDITNLSEVVGACEGVTSVFMTAACIRYYERLAHQANTSYRVNVLGTKNVINACQLTGVKRLIQTSSSNVTLQHNWNSSVVMDEDSPYVTRANSPNHYGWTKAEAEQLVLQANGAKTKTGETLATACARPCSFIFGPFDGFGAERAMREKQMVFMRPHMKLDVVFVDNLVHGHLLLENAVKQAQAGKWNRGEVLGKTFCLTNGEPMTLEEFYLILQAFHSIKFVYAPVLLLAALSRFVEAFHWITKSRISLGELDMLTPAMLDTCLSYEHSDKRARQVLGYKPLYSVDEGVQKSVDEWVAWQKQCNKKD